MDKITLFEVFCTKTDVPEQGVIFGRPPQLGWVGLTRGASTEYFFHRRS